MLSEKDRDRLKQKEAEEWLQVSDRWMRKIDRADT
jgi:hypothetical protein